MKANASIKFIEIRSQFDQENLLDQIFDFNIFK